VKLKMTGVDDRTHLRRIHRKLGGSNRVEAIDRARLMGLVD